MKKIINGKRYDTLTAQMCGEWWTDGIGKNDFNYRHEMLYKKRTGEFFLFGEGHGMTRWASHSGGMSGWGEDILLQSTEQAKAWAEEHLTVDEYEKLFEIESDEPDEFIAYSVRIKPETRDKLDALVEKTRKPRWEILDKALNLYK